MLSDVAELFDETIVTPATDRRMSRRIIDAWARSARGQFPSWADFSRVALGDDWEWMFAVDIEKSVGFPYFIYLGERLAKMSDVYLCGATDWTTTLLEKTTDGIFSAVAEEGPHTREDMLTLCDGRVVQFRAVALPLADDGRTITHVVGGANGRFAPPALFRD